MRVRISMNSDDFTSVLTTLASCLSAARLRNPSQCTAGMKGSMTSSRQLPSSASLVPMGGGLGDEVKARQSFSRVRQTLSKAELVLR